MKNKPKNDAIQLAILWAVAGVALLAMRFFKEAE